MPQTHEPPTTTRVPVAGASITAGATTGTSTATSPRTSTGVQPGAAAQVTCVATPGDPFASLNAQQRAAATHGLGNPGAPGLLVIAGAGTGKTLTLASRVAQLVLAGADPTRILLLTFSRRAAQEMTRRSAGLLHQALSLPGLAQAPQLAWAGTFHAVGARLLRLHASTLGLAPDFSVLDRSDAEDLLGLVRDTQGLSRTHKRFPLKGTCLAIYSRVVNSGQPLAQVLQQQFPWCASWETALRGLFAAYAQTKQEQHLLDYDDLLLYWAQALQAEPVRVAMAARFDHVLVDEYQDVNALQAGILAALRPDGRGLTVVGDDAQAIYGFRAAQVEHILAFAQAFQPPPRVVVLERNYRSTQAILDASNAVMAQAAHRHAKALWTERVDGPRPQLVHSEDEAAQARAVADEVLRQREQGVLLRRQAVLFRTASHSAALELELLRRQIPFVKFGGLKFLETAHIKDVLSVLRWAQNPRHRLSLFRVAQLVPGVGPASARRLADTVAPVQGPWPEDPWAATQTFRPPPAAQTAWAELMQLLEGLRAARWPWPEELRAVQDWYQPQLERLHEDAAARLADLGQLHHLAGSHGSRERFLTELTLDPPQATSDEAGPPWLDEDYLILSTIHSAKGQEWQAVHLLNAVDGCIPSDMATGDAAQIDEERRLLYVALTRARTHLWVHVPQRFYVHQQSAQGDRHLYGALTRFIPPSVAACFDAVGAMGSAAAAGLAGATLPTPPEVTPATVDLHARVRGMW